MIPQFKKDEPSQAQVFYEAIKDVRINEKLTFSQLQAVTGFDVQGKHRELMYRANKILLNNHQKLLKKVRGGGYKMATPEEQLKAAGFRKLRAGRQVRKGQMEAVNLDTSKLNDEQKKYQVFLVNHLSTMLSMSRKRSAVSLEQTKEAKKHIVKAEGMQKEALRQIDEMQRQLKNLAGKFE